MSGDVMRAVLFDRFGDPDVLYPGTAPLPQPRDGDLLVRVAAAGVNRADLLQREGVYGRDPAYGDSAIMGLEVAGTVAAVGSEVTRFRPGDRVMGIVGGGAYAEWARLDAGCAIPVPDGMPLDAAAAVAESFVNAYEAVRHLGAAEPGDPVLVHAAAGGVGSAAVQVAHALGARVFATASAARRAEVEALGATRVFDYREENFAAELAALGERMAAVIDFVGPAYLQRNLAVLRPGGRLVVVGLMGGPADDKAAALPFGRLLHDHLRIIGTVMKSRTAIEKRAMVSRFAEWGLPLLSRGVLRPLVMARYPLEQATQAHRRMEQGGGFGKIVLTM